MHNAGFGSVDRLAESLQMDWRSSRKFQCLLAEGSFKEKKIALMKPATYMNLSGDAVSSYANFYNIPTDEILIVYDDIDLPLGKIRIRPGGSSGGHKGIKSVIERLGNDKFPRLRIGINPGDACRFSDLRDFVLAKLPAEIKKKFCAVLDKVPDVLKYVIDKGIDAGMNKYNGVDI